MKKLIQFTINSHSLSTQNLGSSSPITKLLLCTDSHAVTQTHVLYLTNLISNHIITSHIVKTLLYDRIVCSTHSHI